MLSLKDYQSDIDIKWCPGCGNFGILAAMKDALVSMDIAPEKLLIISGIGQAANTPHYLKCNMFHTLHGRALSIATGAKIANHDLTVVLNCGDGDCYGEGGNHFISTVRRNPDLTLLVHNNKVYGLTKGQASPTSDLGMVTKMQHHGVISESFSPLTVALALGAGFVARGFSGDEKHLSQLIQEGIKHKGLSLIDIMQPCVSFNTVNTFAWYKSRAYYLEEANHDSGNFEKALELSRQWGDQIPVGILYKKEKPHFTGRIHSLKAGSLISRTYNSAKLEQFLARI